jgi:hypothetical protein
MMKFGLFIFGRNITKVMLNSCQVLMCPITIDVNFHNLVKVSSRFLHCKVTVLSFLINKYLVNTLRLCKYPIAPQTSSHDFCILCCFLPESVIVIVVIK